MSTEKEIEAEKDDLATDQVEIEFLMVADWAETINGKLYIQGAGWDRRLKLPKDRPDTGFAIAAGFLVPWHLTNQRHQFSLAFETGDGGQIGPPITGGFNMGRPAKALPGQKFRTTIAARISVALPDLGAYDVKLVVNNSLTKVTTFYVVDQL